MFECHTCLRRAWRALIYDISPSSTTLGLPSHGRAPESRGPNLRRLQSTTHPRASQRSKPRTNEPKPAQKPKTNAELPRRSSDDIRGPPRQRTIREELINQRRGVLAKHEPPKDIAEEEGDHTALATSEHQQGALTLAEKRKMSRALKFLADPLKFSNHINDLLLKRHNVDAALKFVRYASKTTQCVVAWNHIIRWYLANKKPNAAVKLYNEMKKRGQWPDSYTYVQLIRGLADYCQHSTMLSKALNIYHSMSAPNSRVEPRTIHTNMALKICARAGDMDALWGVASRLADKGPQSADGITYSIILNALRRQALEDMDAEESSIVELVRHFDHAVLVGCRVWADVTTKWQRGDLKMDDALVCAMGRLLLLSYRPKAWDAVFSLVQGTENVPRMSTVVEDTSVSKHFPALTPPKDRFHIPENGRSVESGTGVAQDTEEATQLDQFVAMVAADSPGSEAFDRASPNLLMTRPTNNTLSLLLEACRKLLNKKAADSYWKLLVKNDRFGIEPDSENFHTYLRLLRQHRSSTQALRLITDDMKPKQLEQKTFRLAISACIKDDANSSAFANCTSVINLMARHLEEPHIGTLIAYVQFAKQSKNVNNAVEAVTHVNQILHAPGAEILPQSVEAVQSLTGDHKTQLRMLMQRLQDCVAWIEGQKVSLQSDRPWQELHRKIIRSCNLFGRAELKSESTEDEHRSTLKPRSTAGVSTRSLRRLLKEKADQTASNDEMAELPFEVDNNLKEARI